MYLTIKEYADEHGVTVNAIRYQIKEGNISTVTKYGQQLINGSKKYEPIRGRGGKGKKKKVRRK